MILALAFATPVQAQTAPKDTGSMAYPAPVPNTGTRLAAPSHRQPRARRLTPATCSIPAPLRVKATLSTTRTTGVGANPLDTGSMAYPAPLPQGNVGMTAPKK